MPCAKHILWTTGGSFVPPRKLRRYPIDAVAVAAGSYFAGLLGALFDERQFTPDEIRELLREIESDILDPERRT